MLFVAVAFTFAVVVTNIEVGASSGFLDIRFVAQPESAYLSSDGPVMLNCALDGRAAKLATIRWKKDGDFLNPNTPRTSIYTNGSLAISPPLRNYRTNSGPHVEGVYQCLGVIPSVGSILSKKAIVKILSPLEPSDLEHEINVVVGETAVFQCIDEDSEPLRDLEVRSKTVWYRDGDRVTIDGDRTNLLPSGALELINAVKADSGGYHCEITLVKTGERLWKGSRHVLKINENLVEAVNPRAPAFVTKPTPVFKGRLGTDVTFECAANGWPKPNITWLKGGSTINLGSEAGTKYATIASGSLKILNVAETDAGDYYCRAENTEDSVDAPASLQILGEPKFTKTPESVESREKGDAELACSASGHPAPAIQWYKNGEVIIESDYFQIVNGKNLKIFGLLPTDSGVYQCFASNDVGNIQGSARVVVTNASPLGTETQVTEKGDKAGNGASEDLSAPRDLEAVVVSDQFISLTWDPPQRPSSGEDVFGYLVFYREHGSDRERAKNTTRPEVLLQNLKPDHAYDITVVAVTENGSPAGSPSSMQVQTHAVPLEQPGQDGGTGMGPMGGRRHHHHHYHGMSPPSGGGGGLSGSNGIKQLDLQAVALSSTSVRVEWNPAAIGGGGNGKREYSLSYMAEDSAEENFLTTFDTFYVLRNLRAYTLYTIWVGTTAAGGARGATNDVTVRTYSDVPSEPPQNFTAEAGSSKSIVVRWEQPPEGTANGQITGYKLRYKPKIETAVARTVTTDAERRLYAVMGLDKNQEYAFRISALTVNGSGPATKWIYASTLQNDLREDVVPEAPSSIRVRPMPNSIMVLWTPPKDGSIKISGYTIGYGEGLPDTYKQLVDGKQRFYEIQDLKPNTEYVLSVRAFNEKGDGQPVYEQVRTRDRSAMEDTSVAAPLLPPVGIKAIVHSETTVVVFWADAGPPSGWRNNGYFGDERVYTVRYASHAVGPGVKYRYRNTTQMSCMIDDLRPNTRYEFSVRVTVGDRQSGWSMVVENSTEEAVPNSAPQDVTIVPKTVEGNGALALTLNWQPPKKPNGRITGYIIYYTKDESSPLSHWALYAVNGDKMSHTISNLAEETTYYFRIQASNRKGNGPHSQTVAYHTGSRATGRLGSPVDVGAATDGSLGMGKRNTDVSVSIVIAVGVGAAVLLILCLSLVIVFVCKRNLAKTRKDEARRKAYGKQRGANSRSEKPSDMWMHHDQMELASMMLEARNENSGSNNGKRIPTSSSMAGTDTSGGGSLPRRISEFDRKVGTSTSTLDHSRNFGSQYLSKSDLHGLDRSMMTERSSFVAGIAPVGRNSVWGNNNRPRNGPIIVPVEAHPQPPQSLQLHHNKEQQFNYQQQQQQQQQQHQLPQQQHHFHQQHPSFGMQQSQHHFHPSYAPSNASSSSTTTATATAATSPTLPSNIEFMQQHGGAAASFLGASRVSSRLDSPTTPTADTSATTISTGDLSQGMQSGMGGGRVMYPRTQFNVPSSTMSSNASTGTSMTGGRAHVTVDASGHPIGEMMNEQAQVHHNAPGVHFHQPPVSSGPPGYNLMAATGLAQWPQVVREEDNGRGGDFHPSSSSAVPPGGGILKTFGSAVGGPMCTSSTTSLCQSLPGHRDSTTTSSSLASTPPLPPVVVAQPKQFVRPVIQQNSSPFKRPSISGTPMVSMPNVPAVIRPFGLSTGAGVAGMNAAMMNSSMGGSLASSPTGVAGGNVAVNVVNPRIADTKAMGLKPAPSTEELTQEMANLEGLIKDLRVMTANQFEIN